MTAKKHTPSDSASRPEGENVSEIQLWTARVRDLTQSVDWWNVAITWSLVAAALVAIAVGVTTGIAFRRAKELGEAQEKLGHAKEAKLELDLKERDRQIAEVQTGAKQADARIAEAQRGAAEANERALTAQESLASAEQHAKEADAKAEGFRLDIAKANEGAARAQAQVAGATAEAAKANLELARLKTPRTLSKEQQDRITSKIAVFPETPFDLYVNTDSDSTTLMNLIDEAIRAAKWRFQVAGDIQFAGKAGVIAASGVSIHFAAEHGTTLEAPALALGNAILAEGIPIAGVYRDPANVEQDKDRTRIHVMIGSKPLN